MEMESTAASTRFHQPHMERKMSAMTCEIFNELRLEGKLCDVVIKVNGFEFNAHKNILCSCSSYFRRAASLRWSQGAMEMESTAASTRFHQPHMERKMSAMTCEIFNELRLEGKLCDVVIKVNGFEFNAHKNILCSCSSYFRHS
ncbi:Kelch-like protein 10 [Tupaia chinensis]|uniref:Kelch-like protein 10 n=1 Tax=Tupaia chinensis TaxID=246437 RepID=L9K0J0_TUPCH|nr:Kelch-like protein 10 [Tupaia chinensis]